MPRPGGDCGRPRRARRGRPWVASRSSSRFRPALRTADETRPQAPCDSGPRRATVAAMTDDRFEDIRYEVDGTTAVVTIARPERYNAFRGRTVEELIAAFRSA